MIALLTGQYAKALAYDTATMEADSWSSYALYSGGILNGRLGYRIDPPRMWIPMWHVRRLLETRLCFLQTGQYAKALEDYTAALKADPSSSYALYNRGILNDRLGCYAAAIKDFSAAIELEPRNSDFYHNRGYALRKLVRSDEPSKPPRDWSIAWYSSSVNEIVLLCIMLYFHRPQLLHQARPRSAMTPGQYLIAHPSVGNRQGSSWSPPADV